MAISGTHKVRRGCSQPPALQKQAHSEAGSQPISCPSASEQLSYSEGALLNTGHELFYLVLATALGFCEDSHFTDEETETWRGMES